MSLKCSKNQRRNPFTKKCVKKCKKGTQRIRNNTKKKFVCLKKCKKGSVRNRVTNRCKSKRKKHVSSSNLSYHTALETSTPTESEYYTPMEFLSSQKTPSKSLDYYHENSPDYSNVNLMRRRKQRSLSPALDYYHKTSPNYDNVNMMRGRRTKKRKSPSLSPSSQSLEYMYDDKPDVANINAMREITPSPISSRSLEYIYDQHPDFANENELRMT